MAKAHFVKKARKDNPAVKKGESYWWWNFMIGGRGGPKHYSATRPKASQLTSSPYLSNVYSLVENLPDTITTEEDWEMIRDDLIANLEELEQDTQDSLDAMPDGLQEGDIGQLLQERIDACSQAISEIENMDRLSEDDDFEFDMYTLVTTIEECAI
jgi:hypothetical protein